MRYAFNNKLLVALRLNFKHYGQDNGVALEFVAEVLAHYTLHRRLDGGHALAIGVVCQFLAHKRLDFLRRIDIVAVRLEETAAQ